MSNHDFTAIAGTRIGKLVSSINETEFDIQCVLRALDSKDTDRAKLLLIGMQQRVGETKLLDAKLKAQMFETPPIPEEQK